MHGGWAGRTEILGATPRRSWGSTRISEGEAQRDVVYIICRIPVVACLDCELMARAALQGSWRRRHKECGPRSKHDRWLKLARAPLNYHSPPTTTSAPS